MMRIPQLSATLLFLTLSATCVTMAGLDIRRFPVQKELTRDSERSAAVGRFELDNDLYAMLDDPFANLRLLDETGAETPFYLRRMTHTVPRRTESAHPLRIIDFSGADDNVGRIVGELERPLYTAASLMIHTRSRNFEKTVSVYGSHDRSEWTPLLEDARIYDYSRFIDVRNTRIEIPSNSVRYLRIDIADIVEEQANPDFERTIERRGDIVFSEIERRRMREESIRVDRIELRSIRETVAPDEPYQVTALFTHLDLTLDDKAKTSVWTFETERQPIVSFSLDTPSRNFSRQAVVEGRSGGERKAWVSLGRARVFHLDLDFIQDSQLTIPLSTPSRHGQYRITIFNEDNPPLDLSGVIATGHVHEVLFVTDTERQYTVLYGGTDIRAPRYETGSLLANVPSIETVVYDLGPSEPNPAYRSRIRSGSLSLQVLFFIAMTGMIVLLAWFIAKGAGKIESAGGGSV